MRAFIISGFVFLIIILMMLVVSLFCLPDLVSQGNLLGALTDKHEKLEKITERKLLFIGGSNTSFGLDTKVIAVKLDRPAYNMGIHAGLGLRYIMEDITPYIAAGDVIVVMPEYSHFTEKIFYGNVELVSILFDVYPKGKKYIPLEQWYYISKYIPPYTAMKIKTAIGLNINKTADPMYARRAFNDYGDAYIHWSLPNEIITPDEPFNIGQTVEINVTRYLREYVDMVRSKGATIYFFPPAYQQTSFNKRESLVRDIESSLKLAGIPFICSPERYVFADSMFFNTTSHLNKQGVDLRTQRVIEDLKSLLK